MSETTVRSTGSGTTVSESAWLDRLASNLLSRRLRSIRVGSVTLCDGRRQQRFGEVSAAGTGYDAVIRIYDARFYSSVVFGGSIGAAESFIQGYWTSDDLTSLVRVLLRNRDVLEHIDSGLVLLAKPLQAWVHRRNRNTREGSRRNIAAHYDLGNQFFSLWLDERMMYSSAIFDRPGMSLEEASDAKLRLIAEKLRLSAGDRVIEIGTGWGGFAMHAAKVYGCHVTTTTISRQQYEFALEQVKRHGLQNRVTVLFDDYRDLHGKYDKLVSIEMIEAVGYRYHASFFRKCMELLKPNGKMLLQSITIADQRYEKARRSVDFIKRYIFPGGCLPSTASIFETLTRETDLRVDHLEDFAGSYAETLRHWRSRLHANIAAVRKQGYSDDFIRLWNFYLSYCEAAFTERATGVVQMLIRRPVSGEKPERS